MEVIVLVGLVLTIFSSLMCQTMEALPKGKLIVTPSPQTVQMRGNSSHGVGVGIYT